MSIATYMSIPALFYVTIYNLPVDSVVELL